MGINIVFLWSDFTGYTDAMVKRIYIDPRVDNIYVIQWDKKSLNNNPFRVAKSSNIGVQYFWRSDYTHEGLVTFLQEKKPSIVVLSGWMDSGYIYAVKKVKQLIGCQVVGGIDDLWLGTIRQYLGTIYYKLFYNKIFDYLWVSGPPQFSYAQRFVRDSNKIICNLYSADNNVFKHVGNFSKRFIYVGRLINQKQPNILLDAFSILQKEINHDWQFLLIGAGEMMEEIRNKYEHNSAVKITGSLTQVEVKDLLVDGGVACLPSIKDQWGVSVHEYALMGCPLLLSDGVGSRFQFLINGYNGFVFEKGNLESCVTAMRRLIELDETELRRLAENSFRLSQQIDLNIQAYSLLSVL